jgi:hypothetical protein
MALKGRNMQSSYNKALNIRTSCVDGCHISIELSYYKFGSYLQENTPYLLRIAEVVVIVPHYILDDRGSIPGRGKEFFF